MNSERRCKKWSTKVEVFLDKEVGETRQMERGNTRGGATKKREISRTLLSINLHFLVFALKRSAPVGFTDIAGM